METWGKPMARIRGEVSADFLPITSDRSGFITDSAEYEAFVPAMERVMGEVKTYVGRLTAKKEGRRVSRALKDALQRVYRALAANPDLSPFGALPIGDETTGGGGAALTRQPRKTGSEDVTGAGEGKDAGAGPGGQPEPVPKKRKKKPKVKRLTPNAVVKRVKFGETGVYCVVDSFGEDGPEVFAEETTIYINRDHPLYRREAAKVETHTLNLARLITQEISLMKPPKNPRQAFDRQSKLLRDAFAERANERNN
ncbi:MAG: ATP-binding protein, partial [Candidatus Eisenbacteria bacterium]|nr:ATP-binding protein [Candidatus Eisenbacteria bacterium]